MKLTKRISLISIFILTILIFVSCMNKGEIKLNHTQLKIREGQTAKLELSQKDKKIDKNVEWISFDETVIIVENGTLTTKGLGKTRIYAKYNDVEYECNVEVIDKNALSLSNENLTMVAKDEHQLYLLKDSKKIKDKIKWSSSDVEIATVVNGKVKSIKEGRVLIKAKYDKKEYITNLEVIKSPVGNYYSEFHVSIMNRTFKFYIHLKEDKTYVYNRISSKDNVLKNVNKGVWEIKNNKLELHYDNKTIKMDMTNSGFSSVGKMVTGGVDTELTFTRME